MKKQFNPNDWFMEYSSGYLGWRNLITGEWIYDEEMQRLLNENQNLKDKLNDSCKY